MSSCRRVYQDVFAVIDRERYVYEHSPTLLGDVLHARDVLVKMERCCCLDAPVSEVMPGCLGRHHALHFIQCMERLNVRSTNDLLNSNDLDMTTGADLERTLKHLIDVIKAFDDAYSQFGNELLCAHANQVDGGEPVRHRVLNRQRRRQCGLSNRDRSLFKIVYAVAIDKFGYDPKAKKSKATSFIHDATVRGGFEVSKDTIKKILDEAPDVILTKAEKLASDD